MKYIFYFLFLILTNLSLNAGELKDAHQYFKIGYAYIVATNKNIDCVLFELLNKNYKTIDMIPLNETSILIFYSS